MNHASLFSGIGGFDLAALRCGWTNVLQVEKDPFCQRILRHHFPGAVLHDDIRTLDAAAWRGKVDVLSGGFPCQPFSSAGRRRGTEDDRFLWPEMLRVIREIQPTWVVAENVRGIVTQGGGLVFERVHAEMEAAGYEVQAFCIPACAVNAPHKRDRIWFIAHHASEQNNGERRISELRRNTVGRHTEAAQQDIREAGDNVYCGQDCPSPHTERISGERWGGAGNVAGATRGGEEERHQRERHGDAAIDSGAAAADPDARCNNGGPWAKEGIQFSGEICESEKSDNTNIGCWQESWLEAATRLCRVDDGLPRELDGITVPKWRRESLKAYGNAIVPEIAYRIFSSLPI